VAFSTGAHRIQSRGRLWLWTPEFGQPCPHSHFIPGRFAPLWGTLHCLCRAEHRAGSRRIATFKRQEEAD
jgi:hypothetical protein